MYDSISNSLVFGAVSKKILALFAILIVFQKSIVCEIDNSLL